MCKYEMEITLSMWYRPFQEAWVANPSSGAYFDLPYSCCAVAKTACISRSVVASY